MPLLSIIVPIYNVQPYLRECFDSILNQTFDDIELIAVNDRSPDGCAEIVSDYVRADNRLRAIHLTENVGLGGARNAGLEKATGDYVWFVDSDDYIASDSLEAIATRLSATTPDVMLVDYARKYWWGAKKRNMLHRLLRDPDAPEVFLISERAELLRVFPCAWNKVVRRDFLLATGLSFPAGWYEDLPFTYPLLAAAERISVLDKVCYYYRQRRHGAILGTSSERHFELIAQYDRAFERLDDRGPEAARVRGQVLGLALEHCLVVLGNESRLANRSRSRFFTEIVGLRKRLVTSAGYQLPVGASPTQHRLLSLGSWQFYRAARAAHRALMQVRRLKKSSRRKVKRVYDKANLLAHRVYYRLHRLLPLDEKMAIYSIYWGRAYGCNPAAIYESAKKHAPHVHGIWVVSGRHAAEMPPGVDFVIQGSWRYFRSIARAKWLFNNVNFLDHLVKRDGSIHIQTHHGTALKRMGVDSMPYSLAAKGTNFSKLLERSDRWDFSVAASSYSTEIWGRAYPCNYKSLEYGHPRNDVLVNATDYDIRKIRAELGIGPLQRVVLYAPTHREYTKGFKIPLDVERFTGVLGDDAILLIRAHHFYDQIENKVESEQILDVSSHPRIEDLYLAADVLVTDYSSVMFDYAVLDRPIVIFAPDWEVYRATRGTYFNLLREPPGAVALSQEELLTTFETGAFENDHAKKSRTAFRRRFCYLDDGRSSERVVRHVILDETVDLP